MPSPSFFQHAGLFVVPNFLDAKLIHRIRVAMTVAPGEKALVESQGGPACVDQTVRKTASIMVAEEIGAELKRRLLDLAPELEQHFKVRLGGCEFPAFLTYGANDFFTPHSDGGDVSARSDETRRRRVSAVVFLNPESSEPEAGAYGCGKLRFYGLLEGPHWDKCAFSLRAEPGLLIAFPSGMVHEVTPVSHGRRMTVVTWFYAPQQEKLEVAAPQS
jgi:SM-20-related protein